MAYVTPREGENPESLVNRFRASVQHSGILRELKDRRFFRSKAQKERLAAQRAARRRRRAGADGLLGRLARLAKVNVNIDQPRADNFAGGVDLRRAFRRLARRIGADGGHFPVGKQQVGAFIPSIGGVDQASSLEQQRTHGRTG